MTNYKKQLQNLLDNYADGCESHVQLKSKCRYCIFNSGPTKDSKINCMKTALKKS